MRDFKIKYADPRSYNLLNLLLENARMHLMNMIDFPLRQDSLIVDFGCGRGNLTRTLVAIGTTIGLDVDRDLVSIAKKSIKKNDNLDFICADIAHLPLRNDSVDLAIVSSVFEFVANLEHAVREVKKSIKKQGILIAGYPIETVFLRNVIELIDRNSIRMWDPHKIMTHEKWRNCHHTHKHKYKTIREFLNRDFHLLRKEKVPFDYFPDAISAYECVKMLRLE